MVVTLDELRPFDLQPRVTRNPRYDDIKASIREIGLDAAPPITRRPGDAHFIIRNGGNTRLSILRELWAETHNEKFFRITCLFRPWSERGDVVLIAGHLAENDLRGGLTFIERALGVEKARELYEKEVGEALTQKELARRLTQDGYPVAQSHISRMQDTVRYLLPSIPKILFGGLGKHQIERLIALRRSAQRIFTRLAAKQSTAVDFDGLFHDVSATFDDTPAGLDVQRFQDELVGQIAGMFGMDYDSLALELVDAEAWQQSWSRDPPTAIPDTGGAPAQPRESESDASTLSGVPPVSAATSPVKSLPAKRSEAIHGKRHIAQSPSAPDIATKATQERAEARRSQGRAVLPEHTAERVQAPRAQVPSPAGNARVTQDSECNPLGVVSAQVEGVHQISEIWYIEPALDLASSLRQRIGQLAREIAQEGNASQWIEEIEDGLGFVCDSHAAGTDKPGNSAPGPNVALINLLSALSSGNTTTRVTADAPWPIEDLAPLLQGTLPLPTRRARSLAPRLSDAGLLKLFRLIRLARRLVDLEGAPTSPLVGAAKAPIPGG